MRRSQFLLAAATALSPITAYATPVFDQGMGSPYGTSLTLPVPATDSQQQFTVGIAGKMTSLQVYLGNTFSHNGTVEVRLAESSGPYNGSTWLADVIISTGASAAWGTVDLSAASIYVNPGDKFVIDISHLSANDFFYTSNPNGGHYPGGDFYSLTTTSSWLNESPLDMLFKTYVDSSLVASVPEPITLSVLGIGLTGLGLVKRCRRAGKAVEIVQIEP
jgi:hypothetical protein